MRKCTSLLSVSVFLLTLSACHQRAVDSVVTPPVAPQQKQISHLELLPLSESIHAGWAEIEIAGRKWYVDAETILTRNELASLSFARNDKGEVLLHIEPNIQGKSKINHALRNKDGYILMVLNGKAISLSKINSSQMIPFYVGDENVTIQVAEEITQRKLQQ